MTSMSETIVVLRIANITKDYQNYPSESLAFKSLTHYLESNLEQIT